MRDVIVSKFEFQFQRYNFAKYPDGNYVSAVTNEAFLLFKAGYYANL